MTPTFLRVAAFEWRLLRAERTLLPLAILLFVGAAYAASNGRTWVGFQRATIAEAGQEESARLTRLQLVLDSLAADTSAIQPFGDPRSAYTAGASYARRYARIDPAPLGALAVGQSDLFPSYYRVSMTSRETFLSNDEVENPLNLVAGRFDLAFVVVYLLPLVVIALTYNLMSAEREGGTLALLAAQPVGIREVIAGKVIARGLVVVGLTLAVTLGGALIAGVGIRQPGATQMLAAWAGVTVAYAIFWLGAGLLVNLLGRTSATNALALLGVWLVCVVLIPSGLVAAVTALHPTPSRVELMTASRNASNAASARGSQLLAMYYQDHPELMRGQRVSPDAFAMRTIAVARDVAQATKPIVAAFDTALAAQQALADRWRFLSPAIVTHDALVALAGTNGERYRAFQRQADGYAEELERYFVPLIVRGTRLTRDDVRTIPAFEYRDQPSTAIYARAESAAVGIIGAALLVMLAAVFRMRRVAVLET